MKAKQRGLKRKCRNMVRRIEEETAVFPQQPLDCDFWHLRVPTEQSLVNSRATPFKVRHLCISTLIRRAYNLVNLSPMEREPRVVVFITLPDLWDSQIVVFFGEDYFRGFFDRERDEQRWILTGTQLSKQRSLELPPSFGERVYYEEICDKDVIKRGRVWVIGDLEP